MAHNCRRLSDAVGERISYRSVYREVNDSGAVKCTSGSCVVVRLHPNGDDIREAHRQAALLGILLIPRSDGETGHATYCTDARCAASGCGPAELVPHQRDRNRRICPRCGRGSRYRAGERNCTLYTAHYPSAEALVEFQRCPAVADVEFARVISVAGERVSRIDRDGLLRPENPKPRLPPELRKKLRRPDYVSLKARPGRVSVEKTLLADDPPPEHIELAPRHGGRATIREIHGK